VECPDSIEFEQRGIPTAPSSLKNSGRYTISSRRSRPAEPAGRYVPQSDRQRPAPEMRGRAEPVNAAIVEIAEGQRSAADPLSSVPIAAPSASPRRTARIGLRVVATRDALDDAAAAEAGRTAAGCSPVARRVRAVSVAISTIAAITGSARHASPVRDADGSDAAHVHGRQARLAETRRDDYRIATGIFSDDGCVGMPRFSNSMLSWTLHDVQDPQSAIR